MINYCILFSCGWWVLTEQHIKSIMRIDSLKTKLWRFKQKLPLEKCIRENNNWWFTHCLHWINPLSTILKCDLSAELNSAIKEHNSDILFLSYRFSKKPRNFNYFWYIFSTFIYPATSPLRYTNAHQQKSLNKSFIVRYNVFRPLTFSSNLLLTCIPCTYY